VPIIYAQTDEAIEEERRLLYVGITRARERLYLSWALARTQGGRRTRKPSRFLNSFTPGRGAGDRPVGAKDGTGRRGRDAAASKLNADDPLVRSLREWRLTTSRELAVPAYVIFSDATLQAIADTRPVTRDDLARVPGVGAVKLDRHGAAVLAICAEAGGQLEQTARTPAGTGQPVDVDARTGP
jgi:ATP-dependent DNA helicase UvrD/PcrA